MSFDQLPSDVLDNIMNWLGTADRLHLMLTCKIINTDVYLRKRISEVKRIYRRTSSRRNITYAKKLSRESKQLRKQTEHIRVHERFIGTDSP